MFVYSIAKAVRKAYLPESYKKFADAGYQGLIKYLIKVDKKTGRLNLEQICRSAGLGGNPYRDGSYEYYINTDIVVNDAHGVGSFILAAVEMEH
jgi:unsaturated rhamnogalacturonyl hydrolase